MKQHGVTMPSPSPEWRALTEYARRERTVIWFSRHMLRKLAANAHKGGWNAEGFTVPWRRIHEELIELEDAKGAGRPAQVVDEAADVANFVMMLADNEARLHGLETAETMFTSPCAHEEAKRGLGCDPGQCGHCGERVHSKYDPNVAAIFTQLDIDLLAAQKRAYANLLQLTGPHTQEAADGAA